MVLNQTDIVNFDKLVDHPLQTYEWGEFRKKTGVKIIRKEVSSKGKKIALQLSIHKIKHTPWAIGYLPKGDLPTKEIIDELKKIGTEQNCIFIQLEPNVESDGKCPSVLSSGSKEKVPALLPAAHPLFTKYTFILDLTKSEEELLKNMHSKTRYNIKVAQKAGVKVEEDNSNEAFSEYLKLTKETTKRQRFYAHNETYHKLMWETLREQKTEDRRQIAENGKSDKNQLAAHLLVAKYVPPSSVSSVVRSLSSDIRPPVLAAWILFVFKDTLYYPYGASSIEYRNVMASNLIMWEAIRFGKKLGLRKFDMWGALGPNPDKNDPWYGFHRFKEGYGPKLVEFTGSYDLPINKHLYFIYKIADKIRWGFLRLKKTV